MSEQLFDPRPLEAMAEADRKGAALLFDTAELVGLFAIADQASDEDRAAVREMRREQSK